MHFKKLLLLSFLLLPLQFIVAQINTERVMYIGRNALYFEDYVLSIQYFNQVIKIKPYLAEPYFYRSVAKLSLDDYQGAEEDATQAIERNPFIVDAYQVRGIARQRKGNYQGAIEDYDAGLEYAPEDRTFLMNRAIAQLELEAYDEAETSFGELIAKHPSFYNGYLGRGQFYLQQGDTLKALSDIDRAIELDKYLPNAYSLRATIELQYKKEYEKALADIDEAIKLDPHYMGFFINRALIKYHMNDLQGTMSDYDFVIAQEPTNQYARYNRGLLRTQVGDLNSAIEDFSQLIASNPGNLFARYNRALLYDQVGQYRLAVKDFDQVLDAYPSFTAGYYARSEAKRKMGDTRNAEKDYMLALNMSKQQPQNQSDPKAQGKETEEEENSEAKTRSESDKNIQQFSHLLVAENNGKEGEYDNEFRGRVQDKDVDIVIALPYILSYYAKENPMGENVYYNKVIDGFNRTNLLTKRLIATNDEAPLTEYQIKQHFASIDDYSRLIGIDPNTPIPYFGRAMDFLLVQDLESAIEDLNRTILLTDDFALAYFMRAAVRFKQLEAKQKNQGIASLSNTLSLGSRSTPSTGLSTASGVMNQASMEYELILRDYDKVTEIDPQFFYAYYNRGNARFSQRDYRGALVDYTKAIEIQPNFAAAYYNRGLIHLYHGEKQKGIDDLSKAGELGIVAAYNVLKRVSETPQ